MSDGPTAAAIFEAIAHGDQEHRDWLKEALDACFVGMPVPPPRGKGTAEALYDGRELTDRLFSFAKRVGEGHHFSSTVEANAITLEARAILADVPPRADPDIAEALAIAQKWQDCEIGNVAQTCLFAIKRGRELAVKS